MLAGVGFSGCDLVVDYKSGPSEHPVEKRLVSSSVFFYANCVMTDLFRTRKPEHLSWEINGHPYHYHGSSSWTVVNEPAGFEFFLLDEGKNGEKIWITFHEPGEHTVRMICNDGSKMDDRAVRVDVVSCFEDIHCDDGDFYTGHQWCSPDHQCHPGIPRCEEDHLEFCDLLERPSCPGYWTCVNQECLWVCAEVPPVIETPSELSLCVAALEAEVVPSGTSIMDFLPDTIPSLTQGHFFLSTTAYGYARSLAVVDGILQLNPAGTVQETVADFLDDWQCLIGLTTRY